MRERLLGVSGTDLSRVYFCDESGVIHSVLPSWVFHWDDLDSAGIDGVDRGGDAAVRRVARAGVSVADLLAAWQYVERLRASMGDGFQLFDESATCPVCGGVEVSGYEFDSEDRQAWQEVSCDDCGSRWNDVYVMAGRAEIRPGSRVALAVLRNRDAAADRRGLTDHLDAAYEDRNGCGVEL
jgi:hypothetical protein